MFYERFTELCREYNVTVTSVLKELGLSASKNTQWSEGASPSVKNLIKIANYFNVSTDYLLGKDDIKKRPTPEDVERFNDYLKNDEFRGLMEMIAALPKDAQEKVREHVELMRLARLHKKD